MNKPDLKSAFDVIEAAEQLKKVPRIGWILKARLKNPESVADHSYALAVLSMLAGDMLGLDTCYMVKMSLLHDLCESLTGDMQPEDISREEKRRLEMRALAAILSKLPKNMAEDYMKIFEDFNSRGSREAVVVAQLDKVEMALQAKTYRKEGKKGLNEFFDTARKMVNDEALLGLLESL